jgi:hypothetical protein
MFICLLVMFLFLICSVLTEINSKVCQRSTPVTGYFCLSPGNAHVSFLSSVPSGTVEIVSLLPLWLVRFCLLVMFIFLSCPVCAERNSRNSQLTTPVTGYVCLSPGNAHVSFLSSVPSGTVEIVSLLPLWLVMFVCLLVMLMFLFCPVCLVEQ